MYQEIVGDLILEAQSGRYHVTAQSVNCFSAQKSGLAPQMVKAFGTDKFPLEAKEYKGDINKLGLVDYKEHYISNDVIRSIKATIIVCNLYTQYMWATSENPKPVDYEALTLCLRKMKHLFKGKKILLPKLSSGLAGGSWDRIKEIIQRELKDCNITVVIYN